MCQGGVFSPLLFNIYTRAVGSLLPHNFKYAMFADDLLVYTRFDVTQVASEEISATLTVLSEWLSDLGLEVTPGKSYCCFF